MTYTFIKQSPQESNKSKKTSQIIKISFFILIVLLTVFRFDLNQINAAALGDGVFIYDQTTPTTNIQSRTFTESTSAVGAATSPFAGSGVSKHIYTRGSGTRVETLLGIQDAAGLLTIYKSTDYGVTWVSQWAATVGDGNLKRFEIAYEQTSGDALVVYSANVGTTNEIKYQTWNGTAWSGALNLDPLRTTGTVYGIRAAERSGSNEIAIVWSDTNLDLSANLWTGTAWYGERATVLETSLSKIGTGTVPTNRVYDLAFETLSGDLMVVWGTDTVVDAKYVIKPAGGAWGTTTTATNMLEEAMMIDIAASPISDKIAYVNCTDLGGDCDFIVWNGTAWGTNLNDGTSATPVVGDSGNSVEWLVDGTNEVAIFTYNDSTIAGLDWVTSINGATPVAQTDNTTAPAIINADRAGFAKVNPSDSREAVFIFENSDADIFVKRAYLTGTTVAWSNPTGLSAAIELNTSVTGFNPAGFAFIRYVQVTPPTVTTQAVTNNTTGTTATGNGNVTSDGNGTIIERGITWSTSINPTITSNSYAIATGTTGAYTANITGLTAQTFYYARAYAKNSAGTSYGDNVTFTTPLAQAAPTIVLNTADLINVSSKPTLNFTGTDINSDALEYQIQIDTVNTFDSQGSGSPVLIASHPEINYDMPRTMSSFTDYYSVMGQTFMATGAKLTSSKFYLSKTGSVSGNIVSKLYNYTGTVGVNAVPTGDPLAISDSVDIATVNSSQLDLHTFNFSGANQYQLTNGNVYIIALEYNGGDANNYLIVGVDATNSTYEGNISAYVSWYGWSGTSYDAIFYVYGSTENSSLINAVSETDAGFTAGHPFPSGVAKDFTVQTVDTLAPNTYYWRVRAIDPTGTNTYGAWATPRSFTVLGCSATTTGLWNTGTNWTGCNGAGGVPAAGDDVKINAGVAITQNVDTPVLNSLTILGSLNTANDGTSYTLNTGKITLQGFGVLWANASTINLSGLSGTLFNKGTGTFIAGTSTVNMTSGGSSSVWTQRTSLGTDYWYGISSSCDGTKLAAVEEYGASGTGGYIYTSNNSGSTWTTQTNAGIRQWAAIASSCDGTKLVAGTTGTTALPIYTSNDSGVTWTPQSSSGSRYWRSIASSSDGVKLVAANSSNIMTSIDSGVTWNARLTNTTVIAVSSSSDGVTLYAAINGGLIYKSSNSGVNWGPLNGSPSGAWQSIASSSDGTKIVAGDNGGYIYRSIDSGGTWSPLSSAGTKAWRTLASSDDGTKLIAGVYPGYVYLSTDSGVTWVEQTSMGQQSWLGISTSADGNKLAIGGNLGGYLYTYGLGPQNITISSGNPSFYNLTTSGDGTRSLGEALSVTNDLTISGGTLDTTTANNYTVNAGRIIINGGTFTPQASTVNITGASGTLFTLSSGAFTQGSSIINLTGNGDAIINSGSPTFYNLTSSGTGTKTLGGAITLASGGTLNISAGTFNPSSYLVNGSGTNTLLVLSGATLGVGASTFALNYSAGFTTKTFNSGSTINYLLNGNQIIDFGLTYSNLITSVGGTKTLGGATSVSGIMTIGAGTTLAGSIYALNLTASSGTPFVVNGTFQADTSTVNMSNGEGIWTERTTSGLRNWKRIASSFDGTKLAAVVSNGYIYTSDDSGATWTERTTAGSRNWFDIASSSDGTKLTAIVNGGYIYTSIDSGVNWTQRTNSGSRLWASIASSSDGTKLAAGVGFGGTGYIYTSIDSGVNWTQRNTIQSWVGMASSSDGTKLLAGSYAGYLYTSADSGVTWITRNNAPSQDWYAVASSSDGTKLAAGQANYGNIYTSTDSGDTWTKQASSIFESWKTISSSSDGTKLIAGCMIDLPYISTDSGLTWNKQTTIAPSGSFESVASSSDGTKLATAKTTSSYIYTYRPSTQTQNVTLSSGSPSYYNLTITGGGTRSLGGALTVTNNLTISGGTLDTTVANHYDVNVGRIAIDGGTFTPQSSTVNITGVGVDTIVFNYISGSFIAGTSTIKITNPSGRAHVFSGGGQTYNNLWLAPGAGTGSFTISGNNTFNNFKDDGTAAHSILFTTGSTQTISTWNVSGSAGNLKTINSTTTGTHTLNLVGSGAFADSDYLNIQHSIATPANTWYAGANSVNNQNVATNGSGWIFTIRPVGGGLFSMSGYKFFDNTNYASIGSSLSAINSSAQLDNSGDEFRMRLLMHSSTNTALDAQNFKLQYAQKVGTCDVGFDGESYADVTSNAPIAYYDNHSTDDKVSAILSVNDPSHGADPIVYQSYVESNNFSNSTSALSVGEDGLWDFSLYDKNDSNNISYCLRVVKEDGNLLESYLYIPEITTAIRRSRGGGGVSHIESVATPNDPTTGGIITNVGGQGLTACSDGIDNNTDGFIDVADADCHVGGNINNLYVPTYDSESTPQGNQTGGGTGSGGGVEVPIGYQDIKFNSFFNLRNYLYASVLNMIDKL